MDISNVAPELIEKAIGKSPDEMLALAKAEGLELTDEQLDTIAGGAIWGESADGGCPYCKNKSYELVTVPNGTTVKKCGNCGFTYA